MAQLRERLRQQVQRRRTKGNLAILGCGYVGSALASYWQARGHSVTGTTTRQDRVASLSESMSRVLVVKGDDVSKVRSLVEGQDTVVVSVAPTGYQVVDEATYAATYLETARNLLEALEYAPTVKQLIYLSSCSVYGDRQGSWVDENSPVAPADRRGRVLHQTEQIVSQAADGNRKACILRLGGIYGPGREPIGFFGGMVGMTLPGKGDRVINWIHLDDIVGAIEFARLNELEGTYNLVDDSQLTIEEQVSGVCRQYGLPPAKWDPSQPSPQRKSLRVSNQKLKAAGYQLTQPRLFAFGT
ncbi:nucleoside-diphosphate-sugar epimerase [Rubidibacter lacunae KORDI 51-2]|uniref:Nucleoside-diphosphate-sugar epimerase n=1 Tax=Rubidibacter lacunae KORDI 51-2 TaxID=582515 RepID=U5DQJ2_9CHRO|nr:SDR family oxidoreductase [Rubidibacter lacunae]ERN41960.1 nucleoside-diphosphate-sugar epimerase [Rubidibacter lacunae KORDI 51-2]